MHLEPLGIDGALLVTPRLHGDERGVFLEAYRRDLLEEATGRRFELAQANTSTSRRGVLRGLHFADVPPGQAKYVTCVSGRILDMVVDLREGSPSFGSSVGVELDDRDRRAVFLAEGLGHGFVALEDSVVVYFCSTPYRPGHEWEISPFDPDLALAWPTDLALTLSAKDRDAPTLAQARALGRLPQLADCSRWYAEVATG